MRKFFTALLFIILATSINIHGQQKELPAGSAFSASKNYHSAWVDSVFNSLSLEERIAQLLMIRTYSNKDRNFYDSISRLIIDYSLGGLCFFQGDPVTEVQLTNMWQRMAKTPLLISIDAEWGLGMRLKNAYSFPGQMTLGAMQDEELVYLMAKQIGEHCKKTGIHINFAPVVDINSNPKNPVINFRSFGEDPVNVANKGAAYIKGLQSMGVIATAKHFPGHGYTDSDSHYTLPLLKHDKTQIDSIDTYPFKKAIQANVGGIMVAHLFIPTLDSREGMATSLSEKCVDSLLKGELAFEGLAITDALDMNGVTSHHKPGDIELRAFLAGNDILLLPLDIPGAIQKIKKAVSDGLVKEAELNARCRKILAYKQLAGLDKPMELSDQGLIENLNNPINELLTRKIFESAITLVKNKDEILPLQNLENLRIASLTIGNENTSPFQQTLELYTSVEHFNAPKKTSETLSQSLQNKLKDFNLIIISIENTSNSPGKNFGISRETIKLINKLKKQKSKLVLDIFGNPYALDNFKDHAQLDAILVSYEDKAIAKDISAQIIFGAIPAKGKLPVSASEYFSSGTGIETQTIGRLKYSIPEEVGIPRHKLDTIVALIKHGINEKACPGAQIVLAKDGIVFFRHSFGYHTYDNKKKVRDTDIYDLASLTKIAATTPVVMSLYERKIFDIDLPLSFYLHYLKNSNKQSMVTRDILAHQAQLQPWIPFYKKTITDFQPDPGIYSKVSKKKYSIPVANKLFIANNYRDSIFDTIVSSELREKRKYKYSDLGYYLICDAIEKTTRIPFAEYTDKTFYQTLGMNSTGFRPLQKFNLSRIVPTEMDTVFRKQLVHGYVHDPGAAMLGGVSGHAGLFSNANDVAKLMQMYLQGGYYGGKQYIQAETVKEFTKQQFPLDENRRGIGFDKPFPEYELLGPCCESASLNSFGHSGFTGTYTWADPDNGLSYVFLSNRINPDAKNYKLLRMNLRTDLHQLVYDIISEKMESFYQDTHKDM